MLISLPYQLGTYSTRLFFIKEVIQSNENAAINTEQPSPANIVAGSFVIVANELEYLR